MVSSTFKNIDLLLIEKPELQTKRLNLISVQNKLELAPFEDFEKSKKNFKVILSN